MVTTATPAWRDLDSGTCSIARTMTVLGEPWTVLVLRDLLNGIRRFDELVAHLGIARNVLTRRLATLVDAGLVETREYREAGRRTRHEYRPTAAGRDLRPVLLALMAFGDRTTPDRTGAPRASSSTTAVRRPERARGLAPTVMCSARGTGCGRCPGRAPGAGPTPR